MTTPIGCVFVIASASPESIFIYQGYSFYLQKPKNYYIYYYSIYNFA